MVSDTRAHRIAARIRRELAELLLTQIADPRLAPITITDVEVDRELAFATVYVSAVEGDLRREDILRALRNARGHLRSQLAARIELRAFPDLRFRFDTSQDRGARVEALLEQLHLEDQGGERQPSEE
jgi:ribosome-binding factor A